MTYDTEQDVKLQFLEEAQDYLDAIETALLGLKQGDINEHLLAALRAAHSVKGGSAMMGFITLSQTAHRFEDSLKALKSQPDSLTPELETLLFSGLDGLRQISEHNRELEGYEEPPEWLPTRLDPVFAQLRELLGDPAPENDAMLLAESEGQDLSTLMFETEVEARLLELEEALASPDEANLREVFLVTSQDLEAVGEMLELEAFSSLCRSISEQVETASPHMFAAVAKAGLKQWKRSRALVLAGQPQMVPSSLLLTDADLSELVAAESPSADVVGNEDIESLFADGILEQETQVEDAWSLEDEPVDEELLALLTPASTDAVAGVEPDAGIETPPPALEANAAVELPNTPQFPTAAEQEEALDIFADYAPEENDLESLLETLEEAQQATSSLHDDRSGLASASMSDDRDAAQAPVLDVSEKTSVAAVPSEPKPVEADSRSKPAKSERTVRVTIEKLERINDLFGEFAIERNALSLHLSRLQNLFGNLSERVKFLEQSRLNLRTAYDKASATSALATVGDSSGSASAAVLGQSGFDSLEMDRYTELHLVSQELMETIVQVEEIASDVELSLQEANLANNDINRTSKMLQTNLTRLRMRPFQELVGRFPRAVRDLCRTYNKDVRLEVNGSNTLFERAVLETLSDPLMHLMRNAFDHGIEPMDVRLQAGKPAHGTIEISAHARSHSTVIEIKDDGGGINLDKIRQRMASMGYSKGEIDSAGRSQLLEVMFEPGFSTADRVTQLSGRGIGMDIVRSNLQQIRGTVSVETEFGEGTTFVLEVPIALSSMRILMAESAGMLVAFPLDAIEEILLLDSESNVDSKGGHIINWDGYALPVISMNSLVQFNRPQPPVEMETEPIMTNRAALVMVQGPDAFAIAIDRHWGEQEIVVRQVEGALPLPTGFTGCTILGDGQVVPVADITTMFQVVRGDELARGVSAPAKSAVTDGAEETEQPGILEPRSTAPTTARKSVLVVDDSTNVRRFLALTLAKAGYQPEQAKDGQDALDKLKAGLDVQAVICDIEMPRLDGFGFLAHVRDDAKFARLPIAMLTSRSGSKHRTLAMQLGATAYFTKPYQEFELLQKLEEMVNSQVL